MHETALSKKRLFLRGFFVARGMNYSLKAMDLVETYHIGERKCGAPERIHMYSVASILLGFLDGRVSNLDLDEAISASFLHDLPEDYSEKYPLSNILIDFNKNVHMYVSGMTKKANFKKNHDDREEYFNGMLLSFILVMIKCCDRIDNLSTMLGVFSDEKAQEYAEEVEKYFIPMIKKTRLTFPEFYIPLTAIYGTLQRELVFVARYLEVREDLKRLSK